MRMRALRWWVRLRRGAVRRLRRLCPPPASLAGSFALKRRRKVRSLVTLRIALRLLLPASVVAKERLVLPLLEPRRDGHVAVAPTVGLSQQPSSGPLSTPRLRLLHGGLLHRPTSLSTLPLVLLLLLLLVVVVV